MAEERHPITSKKDLKKPAVILVSSSDKHAAEAAFRKAIKIVMENVAVKQEATGKL